jgi:HlyD family secretion protein
MVAVQRGDVHQLVIAEGTLAPRTQVSVGCEVSGLVTKVFKDTNDTVKKNEPLAEIDRSKYEKQYEAAEAAKRQAEEQLNVAKVSENEAKTALDRYEDTFKKTEGKTPSKKDMDAYRATYERAKASTLAARETVKEKEALFETARIELDKTIIRAPLDGIIIKRTVEAGNTVQPVLNVPELFTIADRLDVLKLKVDVSEADIAKVSTGKHASFTVDGVSQPFEALVTKVEPASTIKNNVVTYLVELEVDNKAGLLRTDLSAHVAIKADTAKGVLWVPPAALRFDPNRYLASQKKKEDNTSFAQSLMPRPPRRDANKSVTDTPAGPLPDDGSTRVYVRTKNNTWEPVPVRVGAQNQTQVEVSGPGLTEQSQVGVP